MPLWTSGPVLHSEGANEVEGWLAKSLRGGPTPTTTRA